MRHVVAEDGITDVYVRQSWIKDAIMCPERARNAIIRPEWNKPNELTAFGTAVHAAAEHKLLNSDATREDCQMVAKDTFEQIAEGDMRWVSLQAYEIPQLMVLAVNSWWEDLRPQIRGDVLGVEHKFTYLMADTPSYRLWGEGTIDLITTEQLWDWKTASRKYKPTEKQKQDIQSTMYGGAVVAAGWHEWPLEFRFGVMVRGGDAQVVTVERTQSHFEWLKRSLIPIVNLYASFGLDSMWPVNDTGFLCSEKWCPFWSVCRGCHAQ